MKEEKLVTVEPGDDGQRLDRWLKKMMPFGLAQKLIRKGAIRIDGKKAKPDARIAAGQQVRIPPLQDKPALKKKDYVITPEDEAFIKSLVIYDDGDVLALNKTGDIATQGGGGVERHIDGMLDVLKNEEGLRPKLVHRLDRDTSGVLLLARSPEAVRKLGNSFKGRNVRKIYWAITSPVPEQAEGTITAPVAKPKGPHKDRMVIDDGPDSKSAVTDFIVLDKAGKQAAFVALWPRTGRTHQLRVHLADVLDCPVLGDSKYGSRIEELENLEIPPDLHLHARRLIMTHPTRKETLDITAPLPETLLESWKELGFDYNLKDDPFADSPLNS